MIRRRGARPMAPFLWKKTEGGAGVLLPRGKSVTMARPMPKAKGGRLGLRLRRISEEVRDEAFEFR